MMNSIKQGPKAMVISSPIAAGIVFSILWLAAGSLLLSILLHFTSMKEANLPSGALIVHAVSALTGGFATGKRTEKRGWYYGALLGLIYGLIVLIISFLASDASITLRSALIVGAVALAGAFGGMIGVNMRK